MCETVREQLSERKGGKIPRAEITSAFPEQPGMGKPKARPGMSVQVHHRTGRGLVTGTITSTSHSPPWQEAGVMRYSQSLDSVIPT